MSHYLLLSHSNKKLDFWEKNVIVPGLVLSGCSMLLVIKRQLITCEVSRYNFCCDFIFSTMMPRDSSLLSDRVCSVRSLESSLCSEKGNPLTTRGKSHNMLGCRVENGQFLGYDSRNFQLTVCIVYKEHEDALPSCDFELVFRSDS